MLLLLALVVLLQRLVGETATATLCGDSGSSGAATGSSGATTASSRRDCWQLRVATADGGRREGSCSSGVATGDHQPAAGEEDEQRVTVTYYLSQVRTSATARDARTVMGVIL